MIDTSHLSHVLNIDTKAQTVLVEPSVPMDRLVEATLEYGLVPPVVMEFPGITVGGGFAGTGGESSSFKHGYFDCTVNWIEIVLADGQIVCASKTERPDLFQGAAGTFGTLGVTTLLELRLLEATTHVELTYHPVFSLSEAVHKLQEA
ncbi:fad-binding protein [Lasallia pustulata]|uniref:Delta(24)-sterol reductase n=1 Tax=Lasallia pustulata TaxID=136370 RepID=A0A1W5CS88_9LECA|nr:fad-binding protein [Lasallia pustulata]